VGHCSGEIQTCRGMQDGSAASDAVSAWQLLEDFTKADMRRPSSVPRPFLTVAERATLRDAVLVAVQSANPAEGWFPGSDPSTMLLSVLSGDVRLALRALRDYTSALQLDWIDPESRVAGAPKLSNIAGTAVYVKYRVAARSAFVSTLTDTTDRGVLLQLGMRQIGHLPLNLFDTST